jgi:signal recognition particle receptor subunit beta
MDHQQDVMPSAVPTVKIVVAGGADAGADVSTLITAVSELPPLSTSIVTATSGRAPQPVTIQPAATRPSRAQPALVVAELGRTVLDRAGGRCLVYLFGVACAGWSWAVWDEVCHAAAGLLLVVDPWRPGEASAALDYATSCDLPYLIVIGAGAELPPAWAVRDRLALPAYTPLLVCDLADRHDVRTVLTLATGYALSSTPWKGSPCCYRGRAGTPSSLVSSASPSCWP